MEEKTVSIRNGMFETKLRTGGSGEPLLYLHGAGGLQAWDPFLAELAKSFAVYAPSHPGFESSTGIEHIDDIIDLVVYYNDFLDAIGMESAHVVGHSMGGLIMRSACAVSTPPYDRPQIATRLVSTSGRACRYWPAASTSRYSALPRAPVFGA